MWCIKKKPLFSLGKILYKPSWTVSDLFSPPIFVLACCPEAKQRKLFLPLLTCPPPPPPPLPPLLLSDECEARISDHPHPPPLPPPPPLCSMRCLGQKLLLLLLGGSRCVPRILPFRRRQILPRRDGDGWTFISSRAFLTSPPKKLLSPLQDFWLCCWWWREGGWFLPKKSP